MGRLCTDMGSLFEASPPGGRPLRVKLDRRGEIKNKCRYKFHSVIVILEQKVTTGKYSRINFNISPLLLTLEQGKYRYRCIYNL